MITHRTRHRLGAWLLALSLLVGPAMITAMPVRADGGADADSDGVADAVDTCPNTEWSDIVGPDGCAICSCENGTNGAGWTSQAAYVGCVAAWVKNARDAGVIGARAGRFLRRRARSSTCGRPELVRCCVFQPFDAAVGSCRMTTEVACDALDDRLFDSDGEAYIEDAGSCLPNPCLF